MQNISKGYIFVTAENDRYYDQEHCPWKIYPYKIHRSIPKNLELALYLREHRSMWSISTVQDCIVARNVARTVPIVEQPTQAVPVVDSENDSDSESEV